ncbi:MAG TPA: GNAT family N-acetyltransferase [Flavobacteriales bacterium]|nr:GNAT family N-acetyltransferase [Flavobacteriales bacterium]
MTVERFSDPAVLRASASYGSFLHFLESREHAGFFQSPSFMEVVKPVPGFAPVLFLAHDSSGQVTGSLLGAYQQEGNGVKGWLSRRMLVQGGPLGDPTAADALISALLADAKGKAIFVEFRNSFDTTGLRPVFERKGFRYTPHLNFLLPVGSENEALQRLSTARRRGLKTTLAAGASWGPAANGDEVREFYRILHGLYRSKVRKPLPPLELFLQLHAHPDGRLFVVRHEGRVIGGCAAPVYRDRMIHYWYVCGDNSAKGIQASVLATWASIAHAAQQGIGTLDFMGAGKPGQGYGVHEFKARFGGIEVEHGRYETVLEPALYRMGAAGLKVYQHIRPLFHKDR